MLKQRPNMLILYEQYRKATVTPQQIANDDLRLSLMRIEGKLDAIFKKLDSKESEA